MSPRDLRRRLRLIVVADRGLAAGRDFVEVVSEALAAGAPAVQLRNKGAGAAELLDDAMVLRRLTRRAGALLFVNDRPDVALAADADGVHVGPHDLPVAAVRRFVPPAILVGHSTDEPHRAHVAEQDGASYIGCGTVYPTTTKPDAGAVIGLQGLARVVAAVRLPVVAIGGITPERVPEVMAAGAAGVAAAGAIMTADDPAGAVRAFLRALSAGTSPRAGGAGASSS